jgi:hypothetical protein
VTKPSSIAVRLALSAVSLHIDLKVQLSDRCHTRFGDVRTITSEWIGLAVIQRSQDQLLRQRSLLNDRSW